MPSRVSSSLTAWQTKNFQDVQSPLRALVWPFYNAASG